jgi:hypothetical protein
MGIKYEDRASRRLKGLMESVFSPTAYPLK